jgi:hypothetical protein
VRSFLDLYLSHVGESEIPARFHLWSALSLLAACGSNRVWYERFKDKRLYPNLFVFLIAESGVGKNFAIDEATKFTSDRPEIGQYAGEISYLSLLKRLATKGEKKKRGRMFLVTPELGMSLGGGAMADAFIKHMTELFSSRKAPFEKSAESSGSFVIYDPTITWLAGTTVDWMLESVTPQAVKSGFFARVIAVQERSDYAKRVYLPSYPKDYEKLVEELERRVDVLLSLRGQFTMSERARAIDQRWYMTRPEPQDSVLAPMWRRAPEIVLKLAMVLALSDYELTGKLVILGKHVIRAQQLFKEIELEVPQLVKVANANPQTRAVEILREVVRSRPNIPHWQLCKKASNRGLDKRQILEGIEMLIQMREWECKRLGRGVFYVMKGEGD